jgi:hypothetical protein
MLELFFLELSSLLVKSVLHLLLPITVAFDPLGLGVAKGAQDSLQVIADGGNIVNRKHSK